MTKKIKPKIKQETDISRRIRLGKNEISIVSSCQKEVENFFLRIKQISLIQKEWKRLRECYLWQKQKRNDKVGIQNLIKNIKQYSQQNYFQKNIPEKYKTSRPQDKNGPYRKLKIVFK